MTTNKKQARFVGFKADAALGKFMAIVKLSPDYTSDAEVRQDAYTIGMAAFGRNMRIGAEAYFFKELPECAWEEKSCRGWGWLARLNSLALD